MTRHKRHRPGTKLRSFYIWHRYLGLCALVAVLILALTGLLLNHGDGLALSKRYVETRWLLDWYGIRAPGKVISYAVQERRISQLSNRLYLDEHPLPGHYTPLVGAVTVDGLLVAAMQGQLLLLTPGGEVVERLDAGAGLPPQILGIGLDRSGSIVLATARGDYVTDMTMIQWRPVNAAGVDWSRSVPVPATLGTKLEKRYLSRTLSLERLLLDLHSGRIFGYLGRYLMDLAALLLVVLGGSGFWMWLQQKRKIARRRIRAYKPTIHY